MLVRTLVVVATLTAVAVISSHSTLTLHEFTVPVAATGQPSSVDFGRDVQPILQQHCVTCHGATQQMAGLRLDRRRDALRGGSFGAVIGPGNAGASRLYLRVSGPTLGQQMPPTGALKAEQIDTLKRWIDGGAEWPDAFANDAVAAPPDSGATRIIDSIRARDRGRFGEALEAAHASVDRFGAGGATPLMVAAVEGDAYAVQALLDRGADPNVANEAGATALMWAIPDGAIVRALLARGANPNAKSKDGRTPLLIAAGVRGATEVVRQLLDRGANVNEVGPALFGPTTALTGAAYAGDAATFALLLERGLVPKDDAPFALHFALRAGCAACVEALVKQMPPKVLSIAAALASPILGDARPVKFLLDRGADANARDLEGRTLLMLAAASDRLPIETVRTLIDKGADVHATSPRGDTALTLARQRGDTPIVAALLEAGAKGPLPAPPPVTPQPAVSAKAAVSRSLPLLQKTDVTFLRKSGCVSCHNNTLTAVSVALARRQGIAVDEGIARDQKARIAGFLESWRERVLQGIGIPGDADTIGYILHGLAAENHPPDEATDAMARFLLHSQAADGRWYILAHRPPIESSDIQVTATAIRSLQVYGPARHRPRYDQAVKRAADWLQSAEASQNEERAFQLLGLHWAGRDPAAIRRLAQALVAEQRADGGWAQLPSLASDAYATGQALVALVESGAVATTDAVYRRGAAYLTSQQLADGSWFVRTRAIALQPHFESDFPHGRDQFISAAATNWAVQALALAPQGAASAGR